MQPFHRVLSASLLAISAVPALADTTTYTDSATFLASLNGGGLYTETFDGLANPPDGPVNFSAGEFSYSMSASSGLFASGSDIGTNQIDESITINFTSGNVKSVGANFYALNLSNSFQSVSLTITLSDGTVTTFTPSSQTDSYRGFSTDLTITSLTVSAPGPSLYATLDNLTVSTVSAVPEPASWALASLGLLGLAFARRSKA